MTRQKLTALGVPSKCHDALLDAWNVERNGEMVREAIRLSAATIEDLTRRAPPAAARQIEEAMLGMTVEAAADAACCSRKTIDRAIKAGVLDARKQGAQWIVDGRSFEEWRAGRRAVSNALDNCRT